MEAPAGCSCRQVVHLALPQAEVCSTLVAEVRSTPVQQQHCRRLRVLAVHQIRGLVVAGDGRLLGRQSPELGEGGTGKGREGAGGCRAALAAGQQRAAQQQADSRPADAAVRGQELGGTAQAVAAHTERS